MRTSSTASGSGTYTSREVRERGLLVWLIYAIIGVATGVCGFFIAIGVETLLEIRFGAQCPWRFFWALNQHGT